MLGCIFTNLCYFKFNLISSCCWFINWLPAVSLLGISGIISCLRVNAEEELLHYVHEKSELRDTQVLLACLIFLLQLLAMHLMSFFFQSVCWRTRSFPWFVVWSTLQTAVNFTGTFQDQNVPVKFCMTATCAGRSFRLIKWLKNCVAALLETAHSTVQRVHVCFRLSGVCAEVHNDNRAVHQVWLPLLPAPGAGQIHHAQELQVKERLSLWDDRWLLFPPSRLHSFSCTNQPVNIQSQPPLVTGVCVAEFTCSFPWTMSTSWVPLLPWRHSRPWRWRGQVRVSHTGKAKWKKGKRAAHLHRGRRGDNRRRKTLRLLAADLASPS